MPSPTQGLACALTTSSNQRLLGAALAGLLCLAPVGCSSKEDAAHGTDAAVNGEPGLAGASAFMGGGTAAGGATSNPGSGGAAGSDVASMGGAHDATAAGGGNTAAAGASDSAGADSGNTAGAGAGAGGAPPELAHITSSEAVGVLTEEDFKALCDARNGTVELMPHCGGFATAKGFSYDTGTQLLSQHTCAGANTCGGWNCVLAD